jgi:hypothetical protein
VSTLTPGTVVCHRCRRRFPAQLWTGLHATNAPEIRASVLAETFHRFECPGCGRAVRVDPTLLYTDFDRHHWIATFPDDALRHRTALVRLVEAGFQHNMVERCAPMVREWAPLFAKRCVFGLASLRDKLLCWDAGLDDATLELVKWQVVRRGPLRPDLRVWLDAVEGDRLVFVRVVAEPGVEMEVVTRVAVPRASYDRLADASTAGVTAAAGWVVDWRATLEVDVPLPAEDG